ncbi:MAG TPA: DUF6291 domain-containing protein [Candidatus Limnocylindria bacterium]|nr:DUF6291 domain-containing protein [Candidatus Limnocylindria bacterium]
MGADKRNFILYANLAAMLDDLPDDAAYARAMRAVCRYAYDGEEPDFSDCPDRLQGMMEMVFTVMRRQIDSDTKAYQEKCAANRERGRAGGKASVRARRGAGEGGAAGEDGPAEGECGAGTALTPGNAEPVPARQPPAPAKGDAGARRGGAAFRPPTADEVREYCRSRGSRVDPEGFVDHYTANGWMVGRTRMRDWKAAVRTWERNPITRNRAPAEDIEEEDVLFCREGWREEFDRQEAEYKAQQKRWMEKYEAVTSVGDGP